MASWLKRWVAKSLKLDCKTVERKVQYVRINELVGRNHSAGDKRYDFFNYLKGMVVSGDEKLIKPDPKLYYVLLDRFNINPEETLFIDDSAHNIDTAKLLGFETIHYTPEINLEDKLKEMGML